MIYKKVVFVANTAWSMYNFRRGLLRRLIDDGYKLTVVAPWDDFTEKLHAIGCDTFDLSLEAKGTNPLRDLKLVHELYRCYQRLKPDFIIHYTIKPNIYGSFAATLAGIPSLAITTGLGYTFINNNLIAKVARFLYRIAFHFPLEVWFLNEDDLHVFLQHKLIQRDKAILLHSEGIDLAHFSIQKKSSTEVQSEVQPIRFLLIARMLWDKGVGEYVDAARVIKARYPHTVFQLLGACDVGNPSLIERKQIALWEEQGLVEYLGTTDDVRPLIGNADCVVLPSYREGVPRTLMEAAAMSKPLIATYSAGCRDVVIDGETGFLCPVKDHFALAACCEKIINMSSEERESMGQAGHDFMARAFDEKIVINQYIDALRRFCI